MSLIAATYARKSTSQRGAAKEDTSVERQRTMAEAFIASKGWALGAVYTDDGISGTEGVRLIERAKAAAVRGLFSRSAEGLGLNRLARLANEEYPGLRKWSAQGVRVILTNELYIGRTTFGKSTTKLTKGKKHRVDQPDASQWV